MGFEELDLRAWVESASDVENSEFREAVHTILSAIASDVELKANMVLKGGILLAIRYQSHRFTKDIDLSTSNTLKDKLTSEYFEEILNKNLKSTVELLDYDLDCLVQSVKIQPKSPNPTYPSFKIKIGYAYKGSQKHRKLIRGQSPTTISIDYSLNEAIPNIESLKISDGSGDELLVYSITDLIAEKYRSLLQQVSRNRNRRQDVFDLYLILSKFRDLDSVETQKVLDALLIKARARGIEPVASSLDNPEVKRRAEAEYHTLEDEIEGELPDFDASFTIVSDFYRSLPWK
jgi:predicted nucleotidyltransferase component of viral defense system